jgi:flavin reductase (DIM6/NTAB) family NADH-FMN oxidoreductase RutF
MRYDTDVMISSDQFRQVMGNFASGVTVVTTLDSKGRPYGLTVSAFSSVSLDPVLILVCLANRLSGLQSFIDSKKFGVSILSEAQEDISRMFAKKDSDRPADIYFEGAFGIPLIRGALATLECRTATTYSGGDHTIFLGEVQTAEVLEAKASTNPLLYCRGRYQRLA